MGWLTMAQGCSMHNEFVLQLRHPESQIFNKQTFPQMEMLLLLLDITESALCSKSRHYLYHLRQFTIRTSLKGWSGTKAVNAAAHKMWEICKDLSTFRQETKETRVWSLGQEDPLDEEMATHLSILAWGIPWREEPGRLQSMGHKESDTTEWLNNKDNKDVLNVSHIIRFTLHFSG